MTGSRTTLCWRIGVTPRRTTAAKLGEEESRVIDNRNAE